MSATSWDAVVIGSGLGGLAAGAAYAASNKRVLVLERLANFGGAATAYRHDGLTIEASLHEVDGDTVFGPHGVFARLGLADAVAPLSTPEFYEVRGGPLDGPVQVPHSFEAARERLRRDLPGSAAGFDRWFDRMARLYEAIRTLEEIGARGPSAAAGLIISGGALALFRAARRTLAQTLDEDFGADEIGKCVAGALLPYFDDDAGALSFLLYAGIWSRYCASGSWYFKGGSGALTAALVGRIKAAGGEALRRAEAREFQIDEDGRAASVAYTDDRVATHHAAAPVVFVNCAPPVFAAMAPAAVREHIAATYPDKEPSISLFTVARGLSRPPRDFGVTAYSTFIYPDGFGDFASYASSSSRFAAPPGSPPPYGLADYDRIDAGLRRDGDPYFLTVTGVDRFAWRSDLSDSEDIARRAAWVDAFVADFDRWYPGLGSSVSHRGMATARTMRNRLGTPTGEVYGWRPTPSRMFRRPPSIAAGVSGAYYASAYTVSGGFSGAMNGGLMAADLALRQSRKRT